MDQLRKLWIALIAIGLVLGAPALTAAATGSAGHRPSAASSPLKDGAGDDDHGDDDHGDDDHGDDDQGDDHGQDDQGDDSQDDSTDDHGSDESDKSDDHQQDAVKEAAKEAEKAAAKADKLNKEAEAALAEAQAESASLRQQAEQVLADARAEAAAHPDRADEILAEANVKAATLRYRASRLLAYADERSAELRAEAAKELAEAEAKLLAGALARQGAKDLVKLFEEGVKELSGKTVAGSGQSVSVKDLGVLLNAKVTAGEGGAMTLSFNGATLTFAPGQPVLLNGQPVSAGSLAALPAGLSSGAQFLKDLLQASVQTDTNGQLTIQLPAAAPAPAPTAP